MSHRALDSSERARAGRSRIRAAIVAGVLLVGIGVAFFSVPSRPAARRGGGEPVPSSPRHPLRPPDSLLVEVVGPDEQPVPRAWATIRSGFRSSWTGVRNGRAVFMRNQIPSADAWLEIHGAATEKREPLPMAPWRGPLTSGSMDLLVRLGVATRVEGVVEDASGRAVAGVRVRAFPRQDTWDPRGALGAPHVENCFPAPGQERLDELGWAHGQDRTDASGRFTLEGLGDLDYALWVDGPAYVLQPETLRVRGGTKDVLVRLRQGATAKVTVLDAQGRPLRGAVVWAQDQTGLPLRESAPGESRFSGFLERTGPDGVATLRGLEPGKGMLLTVRPPDGDVTLLEARFPVWVPSDTTARLDAGRVVTARVRDAAGRPVGAAWVQWKEADDPHDPWRTTEPVGADRFATKPVRSASRVALRARDRRRRDATARAAVTIDAGATDATLILSDPSSLRIAVEGHEEAIVQIGDQSVADGGASTWARTKGAVVTFRDLWPETTYSVHVEGRDGRHAWRRGVAVSSGEVPIALEENVAIRGRVGGRTDLTVTSVVAHVWGYDVGGRPTGANRFEVVGLPEGRFRLEATVRDPQGVERPAWGWGVTGRDDVEIDLVPR